MLFTSTGFALGNVLQRAVLRRGDQKKTRELLPWILRALLQPRWIAGAVLLCIATLAHYQAIDWFPLSQVQAFSALHPALCVLFSHWFLHEVMRPKEWIGFAIILIGLLLICYPDPIFPPIHWEQRLAWIGLITIGFLFIWLCSRLRRLALPMFAGILLGLSLVCWKGLGQTLSMQGEVDALFLEHWKTMLVVPWLWFYALFFIAGNAAVQVGLAKAQAGLSVVAMSAMGLIVPICSAVLLFGERLSYLQALALFPLGLGLWLLQFEETRLSFDLEKESIPI